MFNKTVLAFDGPTHHHTHIEMVDPSVEKGARFLNEVQQEAEKRIVKHLLADVPSIGAKLVLYDISRSFETEATHHRMAFKINGHEFDMKLDSDPYDNTAPAIEQLAAALTHEILRQIAPSTFRQLEKL